MYRICALAILTLTAVAGAQSFNPRYFPFQSPAYPFVQVDLNGDGIPDFVATHADDTAQLYELLSAGGGNFIARSAPVGNVGYAVASGDFNSDGKADVVSFYNFDFTIGYGDGKGTFTSFQTSPWTKAPSLNDLQTQVADFNGDGRADLAIAFDTPYGPGNLPAFEVVVFLNNGKGFADGVTVFQQSVPSGSTIGFQYTTPLDLVLGDFDSDGHADLVLRTTESDPNNPANPVTTFTALYGNGAGVFTSSVIASINDTMRITAADINNDGATDLVGADFSTITIFYGGANRSFTRSTIAAVSPRGITPMIADVDGNGLKDVVYASLGDDGSSLGTRTLLQSPLGTFRQQAFEGVDSYSPSAGIVPFSQTLVGDYNRDGKPDVAIFSTADTIQHPLSAEVLINTRAFANGSCQAPAPVGIHVCSPVSKSTVSNPVSFAFSATSFYPVRKMEVWIDGVKRSETYEVFANEGFSKVKLTLTPGSHRVALFSGGFDGTVQHVTYSINVK